MCGEQWAKELYSWSGQIVGLGGEGAHGDSSNSEDLLEIVLGYEFAMCQGFFSSRELLGSGSNSSRNSSQGLVVWLKW